MKRNNGKFITFENPKGRASNMTFLGSLALGLILSACSNSKAEVNNKDEARDSMEEVEQPGVNAYPDTVSLIFFGDAMQHKAQLERARILGTKENPYDFSKCFTLIAPAVEDADYAIVNLELPLGGGNDYSGYPMFSAPDSYAVALKDAGFDLFLTSNNHALDRRDRGVRRTLDVLDSLKVDHIGTYHNAEERESLVPFIKEINGMKIGFLNYTYGTNGIKATSGAEVAYINREKIKKEIEATRQAGAEFVIVAPHWGIEYVLLENGEQRSLADFMIKEGADMVIGGHPHVVQPMKMTEDPQTGKRNLVVYSLGNFISNMTKANTRGGAFVRVVLERGDNGTITIRDAEYDTFVTEVPSGPGTNFRVVPSWAVDSLPTAQKKNWTQHNTAVQNLYDKHNVGVKRSERRY